MLFRRGWEGAAPKSDAAACASVPRLSPFFFFFQRIRADSASIHADSAKIGPNRVVSAGDRNRLKSDLNEAQTS